MLLHMSIRRNTGPNSVAEARSLASSARTRQVSWRLPRGDAHLLPLPFRVALGPQDQQPQVAASEEGQVLALHRDELDAAQRRGIAEEERAIAEPDQALVP